MAEWRERGFVPDSEDEDDSLKSPRGVIVCSPQQAQVQEQSSDLPLAKKSLQATQGDADQESAVQVVNAVKSPFLPNSLGDGSTESRDPVSDPRRDEYGRAAIEDVTVEDVAGCDLSGGLLADRLESAIQFGLRTTAEILRGSSSNASRQLADRSLSSSPLSSLGSFTDHESPKVAEGAQDLKKPVIKTNQHQVTLQSFYQPSQSEFGTTFPPQRPVREFRQRKAVQLHPYALDAARHQQEWRAHGLKPVFTPSITPYHGINAVAGESQDQDFIDISFMNEDSNPAMPFTEQGSEVETLAEVAPMEFKRQLRPSALAHDCNNDDELPELSEILYGGDTTSNTRLRHKKRKCVHTLSEASFVRRVDQSGHFECPPEPYTWVAGNENGGDALFEIPPSPPRSATTQSIRASQPVDRLSQQSRPVTPKELPTPILSSSIRVDKRPALEAPEAVSAYESTGDFDRSPSRSTSPETVSGSSTLYGIQKMQRKMKGVLPASWLKLDLKKQGNNSNARERLDASQVGQPASKGVARRIVKPSKDSIGPEHFQRGAISISDESFTSESSSDEGEDVSPGSPPPLDNAGIISVLDEDDVEEHDQIDLVAPPTRRTRRVGKCSSKRHVMTDVLVVKRHNSKSGQYSSLQRCIKHQRKIPDHAYRQGDGERRETMAAVPRLGILDAPGFVQLAIQQQPQFLKIAARQVRARDKKGRQSPFRKFLQLATVADTVDANSDLLDWRNGRLRPCKGAEAVPVLQTKDTSSEQGRSGPVLGTHELSAACSPDIFDKRPSSLKSSTEATIEEILYRDLGATANSSTQNATNQGPPVRTANTKVQRARPTRRGYRNHSARGRLLTSSVNFRDPRTAQFEIPQSFTQRDKSFNSLRHHFTRIGQTSPRVLRPAVAPQTSRRSSDIAQAQIETPLSTNPTSRCLTRKRTPQQLDVKAPEFQQGFLAMDDRPGFSFAKVPANPLLAQDNIQFRSFTLREQVMEPLLPGTFYHESSIIGSGVLSIAISNLKITPRSLVLETRKEAFVKDPKTLQTYTWSCWNEKVESNLAEFFDHLIGQVSQTINANEHERQTSHGPHLSELLPLAESVHMVIKFVSEVLWFEETTDIPGFVQTLSKFTTTILPHVSTWLNNRTAERLGLMQILNALAILVFQVVCVASHPAMPPGLANFQDQCVGLLEEMVGHVLCLALHKNGLECVKEFIEANKRQLFQEAGIKDDFPHVDAVVIVNHLLKATPKAGQLWDAIGNALERQYHSKSSEDVVAKLVIMHDTVSAVNPILEIDSAGVLSTDLRFAQESNGWSVVEPVLDEFLSFSTKQGKQLSSANALTGSKILAWCLGLATHWGWQQCDTLIRMIFGHYASHNMDELFAEWSMNSPAYLRDLRLDTAVKAEPGDTGFHSWLKLTVLAIQQKVKSKQSIGRLNSFIFSLNPNSGQTLRKDDDLTINQLVPLRNRHDLYSALYSLAPLSCRPRLVQIEDLVDISQSHIDACRVALTTWSRLVEFQISSTDDYSALHGFAEWLMRIIQVMISQHELAEKEVISQLGRSGLDERATQLIRANQGKVEDFLKETLLAWSGAIRTCRDTSQATSVITTDGMAFLFKLCSGGPFLGNAVFVAMVTVLNDFVQKWISANLSEHGGVQDEPDHAVDALNSLVLTHPLMPLVDLIYHPLKTLLSNVFGAARPFTDDLLTAITDCWFGYARALVPGGLRSWEGFIHESGVDSWYSLPDTRQMRQYKVYFVTRVIQTESSFYDEHRALCLKIWVTSLLLPRDCLKFEHFLTTAILRHDVYNPLLFNTPFVITDAGSIPLPEIVDERLTLMSVLIENMHKCTTEDSESQGMIVDMTEDDYRELLDGMMKSMKSSYGELGSNPEEQREYTELVHCVLEEMSIYTQQLCPIDPWFTNGVHFPAQPNNIFMTLRGYGVQMTRVGLTKSMIHSWIHMVQNHVVEGQNRELVDFLKAAFIVVDRGTPATVDEPMHVALLRLQFFQNVFPSYISRAFSKPGYLLVTPILQVVGHVYRSLICRWDFWNLEKVKPFVTATHALLAAAKDGVEMIATQPTIGSAARARIMGDLYLAIHHILMRCRDFGNRFDSEADLPDVPKLWSYLWWFADYAGGLRLDETDGRPYLDELDNSDGEIEIEKPTLSKADDDLQKYTDSSLGKILRETWKEEDDDLFVVEVLGRGGRAAVGVVLRSTEAERHEMNLVVKAFCRDYVQAQRSTLSYRVC